MHRCTLALRARRGIRLRVVWARGRASLCERALRRAAEEVYAIDEWGLALGISRVEHRRHGSLMSRFGCFCSYYYFVSGKSYLAVFIPWYLRVYVAVSAWSRRIQLVERAFVSVFGAFPCCRPASSLCYGFTHCLLRGVDKFPHWWPSWLYCIKCSLRSVSSGFLLALKNPAVCCCSRSYFSNSAQTLFDTGANLACGLLNREKRTKTESLAASRARTGFFLLVN